MPTGSTIQVVSATFGSYLVLILELDFVRASAVSAAFFSKIQVSFCYLCTILGPFSIALPVLVFQKQVCFEMSSSVFLT